MGVRCIFETELRTRGRLAEDCLIKAAPVVYQRHQCGSNGEGIEYIAHSRAVRWLNLEQPAMSAGGIDANIQWEMELPIDGAKILRPDIVIYDRYNPVGPLDVIEVKTLWNRDYDETQDQLDGYVRELRRLTNRPVRYGSPFLADYSDTFRVEVGYCSATNSKILAYYLVTPSAEVQGMLVVEEVGRDECAGIPAKFPVRKFDRDMPLDEPVVTPVPKEVPIEVPEELPDPFGVRVPRFVPNTYPLPRPTTKQCEAMCITDLSWSTVVALHAVIAERNLQAWNEAAADFVLWLADSSAAFDRFRQGMAYGDPHLATMDGLKYDLQAVGEFDLISSEEWELSVQARFAPLSDSVSVVDRVATSLNGHTVELSNSSLVVDHSPMSIPEGGYLYFDGGAAIHLLDGEYLVVWPGQTLRPMMTYSAAKGATFYFPPNAQTTGLLGNNNGSRSDEFVLRDGTDLGSAPTPETIHGIFADSWRIDASSSKFTYAPDQSTATFTDLAFPSQYVTMGDFNQVQIHDAAEICSTHSVVRGPQFDACVYDLLVTGDQAFASSASLIRGDLVSVDALKPDASGKVSVDFEAGTPSNFDDVFLSTDTSTSRYAGPIVDGGGYGFSIPDMPAHLNAQIRFDLLVFGGWNGDAVNQSVKLTVDGALALEAQFLDTGNAEDPVTSAQGLGQPTFTGHLASGVPYAVFPVAVTVDHRGPQLRAEIKTTGMSSLSNKVVGVDNIRVDVQPVSPEVFDVTLPVSVSNGFPGTGAGNLETEVSSDQYRFTVPAGGQSIFLDNQSWTGAMRWTLTNTTTGTVVDSRYSWDGDKQLNNLTAGQYTLDIAGTQDAKGTYALELR